MRQHPSRCENCPRQSWKFCSMICDISIFSLFLWIIVVVPTTQLSFVGNENLHPYISHKATENFHDQGRWWWWWWLRGALCIRKWCQAHRKFSLFSLIHRENIWKHLDNLINACTIFNSLLVDWRERTFLEGCLGGRKWFYFTPWATRWTKNLFTEFCMPCNMNHRRKIHSCVHF